jgi:hypothetical protein
MERFPADRGDRLHTQPALAVTLDEVKANFEAYGLLDEQVRFLPGWFRDTLPGLENERWSLVRLDGDLYESTLIALEHLYPSLAPEGFLVVDDYGALPACKAAVERFREDHGITERAAGDDRLDRGGLAQALTPPGNQDVRAHRAIGAFPREAQAASEGPWRWLGPSRSRLRQRSLPQ